MKSTRPGFTLTEMTAAMAETDAGRARLRDIQGC